MEIYGNKLVNTKSLYISSSNFAEMLTMVNPIDFGGHSSKMGIIDKCGVRRDATLCVVVFLNSHLFSEERSCNRR